MVLAQRNVRNWIHTENLRMLGTNPRPDLKALAEGAVAPSVVYDDGVDLFLGSRKIQVRSFPGHTGGDSVVIIPDAKVVFAGDLFWRNTLPNLIDATTESWAKTLELLVKDELGFAFVPGHGDVGTTKDVIAFQEYLTTLRYLVTEGRSQKKSGDGLIEAVLRPLTAKYSTWDFFQYLAKPNILDVDAELSGKKRIPQPAAGR